MTKEEMGGVLERFIRLQFDVKPDDPDFSKHVHLFDYGYIDSFGAVELTSFVERTFDIKINDSDLIVHPLNTIDEIISFVIKSKAGEI